MASKAPMIVTAMTLPTAIPTIAPIGNPEVFFDFGDSVGVDVPVGMVVGELVVEERAVEVGRSVELEDTLDGASAVMLK
jgi:hypothetical protein